MEDQITTHSSHKTTRFRVFTHPNFKVIVVLLITSMFTALLYGYLRQFIMGHNIFLVKMTSILCLATVVYIMDTNDRYFNKVLVAALLLHCLGDGAIENFSDIAFAIPFFLFGHALYCIIFLKDIFYDGLYNFHKTTKVAWWQYAVIMLLVIIAILIGAVLLPSLSGILLCIVVLYMTVLSMAAILSVLHPAFLKWLGFGISLYIISDCLIAYDAFVAPLVIKNYLSWPLYYFAQLSIVYALLNYHLNLKFHNLAK